MSASTTRQILRAVSTNDPGRRRDHITTIYGVILLVVMTSAITLHGVSVTLHSAVRSPGLACASMLVGVGLVLRAAQALGPAAMSPAIARWLGSSPLPRADLLRRRFVSAVLLLGCIGALCGIVSSLTDGDELFRCALGALFGMIAGCAGTVAALWAQSRRPGGELGRAANGLLIIGLGLCPVMTVARPPVASLAEHLAGGAVAAVALVVCLVGVVRHRRWLAAVPVGSLREAGAATHAWLDAGASLDVGGATARAQLGRARRQGAFPSRPIRARGPYTVLVERQIITLRRRLPSVAVWLFAGLLVWLADRWFGPTSAAVVLVVVLLGLAMTLTSMLRTWLESSALWRMIPQDPRRSTWALACVPCAVVFAGGGAVGWASGLGVGGVTLALGAMTFVLRRHRRPGIELGQTVDTPFGQVPMGIVVAVMYGTESSIAALLVGLNFSWLVALAVSAAWFFLALASARPVGFAA